MGNGMFPWFFFWITILASAPVNPIHAQTTDNTKTCIVKDHVLILSCNLGDFVTIETSSHSDNQPSEDSNSANTSTNQTLNDRIPPSVISDDAIRTILAQVDQVCSQHTQVIAGTVIASGTVVVEPEWNPMCRTAQAVHDKLDEKQINTLDTLLHTYLAQH